jgi:hypothetical protein
MDFERWLFWFLVVIRLSVPNGNRVRFLLDCWNTCPIALLGKQFVSHDFGKKADEGAKRIVHRTARCAGYETSPDLADAVVAVVWSSAGKQFEHMA